MNNSVYPVHKGPAIRTTSGGRPTHSLVMETAKGTNDFVKSAINWIVVLVLLAVVVVGGTKAWQEMSKGSIDDVRTDQLVKRTP